VIEGDLKKDELIQVLHSGKKKGVEDRHEIKKTDKIIEGIGEWNEKIFFFRYLKEEGDCKKKRQDDEAPQHEAFDAVEPLLTGIGRDGITEIHAV